MSKEQQQGGTPSFDDIPPYERIMRERAAAAAKEKEAAAQAAAQDAKSDQESRGQWATRPMAAQTATAAKRPQRKDDDHPATLAEAAAKRAEARQKAAQAAKARQAAMQAEREAQLAEEAARKAEAASAPQAQAVASEAQDVRADKAAEEAAAAKTAEAAEPAAKTKRPAPVAASKKEKKSRARREEPAKRGRHHRRRFPWVAVIMLVCIAVVVLAVTQIGRNWLVPANANDTQIVEVEIPEGTPVSTMGDILEEQGLIRSSSAFSLLVRVQGAAANLQAGVHDLSPSMTMPEIVAALQEAAEEAGMLKVTVNEGLTVDQIAEVVADSTSYSAEDFLNLMSNQEFLAQLVQQYPMKNAAFVRFPYVIGRDDYTDRLYFYVEHVVRQKPMYIDNMDAQMSFISVDDAGRLLAHLGGDEIQGAVNGASRGTISPREILTYVYRRTGKEAFLDETGDPAPYNGTPGYSINTERAGRTGFVFSNLKDWIYELLDFYIERAAEEMRK